MNLHMAIDEKQLLRVLKRQLASLFEVTSGETDSMREALPAVLSKIVTCFSRIKTHSYSLDGVPCFNYLHSAQYTYFLCMLRQTVTNTVLGDKLYYLNKVMNGLDTYSAKIPDFIFFEHPLGAVFGRAALGEYCTFYQQTGLGGAFDAAGSPVYPIVADHVIFFSNAKALGSTSIGSHSILAANACVVNQEIPPNSLVFGQSPHLMIKKLPLERYRNISPFILEDCYDANSATVAS